MTHILIIAAGVRAPWTEGRKNFVRELAGRMRERGLDVDLVTGAGNDDASVRTQLRCLFETTVAVLFHRRERPSNVYVFPYGRFDGLRGLLNRWSSRLMMHSLRARGLRVTVVLYSCAGADLEEIHELLKADRVKAVGMGAPHVQAMRLGREPPFPEWSRQQGSHPRKLLFLSGYQGASPGDLDGVLYERGLRDLLDAGDRLAKLGFKLTIAMPMLKFAVQRQRLRDVLDLTCPTLNVLLEAEVDWRTIFSAHDVFVFPYRSSHGCFIPTSVLEAMLAGIPVVISDLRMFDMLVRPPGIPRVSSFAAGSSDDLVRVLAKMREHWQETVARATTARDDVRSTWTIEGSLDDLLS